MHLHLDAIYRSPGTGVSVTRPDGTVSFTEGTLGSTLPHSTTYQKLPQPRAQFVIHSGFRKQLWAHLEWACSRSFCQGAVCSFFVSCFVGLPIKSLYPPVYALWSGDRRIGLFLLLLFVLHLVLFVVFWGIAMEDTKYQDSNCFMTDHLPKEAIYLW